VAADFRRRFPTVQVVMMSAYRPDFAVDHLRFIVVVGAPEAPAACGEIAGDGSDVYVPVPTRSDAELGRIAWLHVQDDRPQVSLFVGEGWGGAANAASTEAPSSPPEPPSDETSTPTAGETETYTSPSYGYAITYGSAFWGDLPALTNPAADGPIDSVVLRAKEGGVQAELDGLPRDPSVSALDHIERVTEIFLTSDRFEDDAIRRDADGKQVGGDDRACVVLDLAHKGSTANGPILTYYVES
jgi:hypothetical protein